MTPEEQDLYQKICDFKLDQPDEIFPFSHKLSWEHRWSQIYTIRVIQEYKKFIFLAMVAEHHVSPSIPVDQVWHLHLLYTHSYWDQLCTEVLKKPLHHNPGTGGKEEGLKYQNLREQTLKTYRNYFGTPPADIWDDSHLRGKSINFQWIDSQQYWILPNPIYWLKR
ncbi:MAG TPA: hypothetical protein V6C58_24490 [Allocoleopsis sp.]